MNATFIGTPNLCLTATISASSAEPDRPVSYLANHRRWQGWRSVAGVGDAWAAFDFGATVDLDGVVLVDMVGHTGGSVQAQTSPDGMAWTDVGAFAAADVTTGLSLLWFVPAQSTKHLRIYFVNTGAVSEAVDLGVCVSGATVQPTINVTDDLQITDEDLGTVLEVPGGQRFAQRRARRSQITAAFESIGSADMAAIRAMIAAAGPDLPFVAAVDPANAGLSWYSYGSEALTTNHRVLGQWDLSLNLQEAR